MEKQEADEAGSQIGFADSPEGFDDTAFRGMLQISGNVVLNGSRVWEIEMFPDKIDELTEIR